jgi:hypothetical protein
LWSVPEKEQKQTKTFGHFPNKKFSMAQMFWWFEILSDFFFWWKLQNFGSVETTCNDFLVETNIFWWKSLKYE